MIPHSVVNVCFKRVHAHMHTHTRIKQERLANHDGAVQLYGGLLLGHHCNFGTAAIRVSFNCMYWLVGVGITTHVLGHVSCSSAAFWSLTVWAIAGHSGSTMVDWLQ